MTDTVLKPFATVNELADYTGLSAFMLRRLLREDKLPFIKSGKKYLINTSKALRILNESSEHGSDPAMLEEESR